jgi:hypothetical protein
MDLAARFQSYAADFERTYADDDWTRLEQYFAEDAVYSTTANGMRIAGRVNVLAVLRAAISSFDRLCDSRLLETTDGPRQEGDQVVRKWACRFALDGAPDLHIEGNERAVYRGDRIELLEVAITPETFGRLLEYRERYVLKR